MQSLPNGRQEKLAPQKRSTQSTRQALATAFASFTQTAGALETTYVKLQTVVERLRHELETKNRSLALSLEENKRMRSYLSGIVESLPCGVLVFDRAMKPRMINPAASRLLSPIGDGPSISESSTLQLVEPLLSALPQEVFSHEQEWGVKGSQGERTLAVTRTRLQANDPEGDSILILRDLTESKQLEQEREASRHAQALAEVATLLAHEIRNPLGSLELFAGLLADALIHQPELQAWINHVQAGLRSLAATVNNVLNFHAQPSAQLIPVDLRRLIGETVEFLYPLAKQQEMQIAWQPPKQSVPALADPSRLRQAFLNLALNAFRAMKPGGRLSISIGRREEGSISEAVIAFADQGTGISTQNLERIFEPGFSTQCGSPGLGLAVTRKVFEQHGGSICVESQEGQGTTFMLTLPLASDSRNREI